MLCEYKNIFGEPGKGLHSYRIFNIAIIDVLGTLLITYVIHKLLPKINFILIFVLLFILGELLHKLFCVNTTVIKLLS